MHRSIKALVEKQMRKQIDTEEALRSHTSIITSEVCDMLKRYLDARMSDFSQARHHNMHAIHRVRSTATPPWSVFTDQRSQPSLTPPLHLPPVISHQSSVISHQPSAASHQPSLTPPLHLPFHFSRLLQSFERRFVEIQQAHPPLLEAPTTPALMDGHAAAPAVVDVS